jgi:hypothetical protein
MSSSEIDNRANVPEEKRDSPSGTILEHVGGYTNWVHARELGRVMKTLYDSATQRHTDWLGNMATKYLTVRMDMRFGHFIILDNQDNRVDGNDEILRKFGFKPKGEAAEGNLITVVEEVLDRSPTATSKYVVMFNTISETLGIYTWRSTDTMESKVKNDLGEMEYWIRGFADTLTQAQRYIGYNTSAVAKIQNTD